MTINWSDVRVGDIQRLRDGRRQTIVTLELDFSRAHPVNVNGAHYYIDGIRRTDWPSEDDIMAICHPGDEVNLLSEEERSELWDKMEEHDVCLQEALEVIDPRRRWSAYTKGSAFYY